MRILSAADVRKALPIPVAIEAMRHAFASLSAGQITLFKTVGMAVHEAAAAHAALMTAEQAGLGTVVPW
jgi:ornithine cyclodeaminase/alanine dehydrogenase-like protein (mu-crystallin family)